MQDCVGVDYRKCCTVILYTLSRPSFQEQSGFYGLTSTTARCTHGKRQFHADVGHFTKARIHFISQYCAVNSMSDPFVSKSSVFIDNTIFAIIYRIYLGYCMAMHMFLKKWRSKFRWKTKTNFDGCGPKNKNRAAGSEETSPLQ